MLQVLPGSPGTGGEGHAALCSPPYHKVGRSASVRKELKESSPQSVMGCSLSKAAGLGMVCGSCQGQKPIKALGRGKQEWGKQKRIRLRQGHSARLEWMSGPAKKLTEALNADSVPKAIWGKRNSTHLAHGTEQVHPRATPVTSMLQGLPLMKMRHRIGSRRTNTPTHHQHHISRFSPSHTDRLGVCPAPCQHWTGAEAPTWNQMPSCSCVPRGSRRVNRRGLAIPSRFSCLQMRCLAGEEDCNLLSPCSLFIC